MTDYLPNQCEANRRNCECGYRFTKDDGKWQDGATCPQCGKDRRCQRKKVTGSTVCQVHGAGSAKQGRPGGAPNKGKTLRSKNLPKRLKQGYEESLNDPRLLELQNDIALVNSRVDDLLGRVDKDGTDRLWPIALEAFKNLRKADRRGNYNDKVKFETELESILETGNTEFLAWQEIHTNLDLKRKLVESERRRLVEADQMVSKRQLMALMTAFIGIIENNVPDPRTRAAIGFGINRLLTLEDGGVTAIEAEYKTVPSV